MEVDVDFGNYGILDVDVSVGGGIHPHIQYPKKCGCRPLMTSKKIRLSSAVFKSMAKQSWLFSSTCKTLQTRNNTTIIDNDWQSWSGKNLEYIKENYASIWKLLKTFGKTILIHDSLHFENLFKKKY